MGLIVCGKMQKLRFCGMDPQVGAAAKDRNELELAACGNAQKTTQFFVGLVCGKRILPELCAEKFESIK